MIKRVMGLDVSSTTIGICLLELDDKTNKIKLAHLDHFKPIKKGTLIERLRDTRNKMADIINQLRPDFIGIEDIIAFMPHRSSANTIITLAVFNRMMALLSFDYLGKPPQFFDVMDMRRGLQKTELVPKKEDMPELIAKHLGITFPWIKSRRGKILVENFDRADGVAVALFYAYILSGRLSMPIHLKKKKTTKNKKVKKKK